MKPKRPKFDANRPENCRSLICDGYIRYWNRDNTEDYFLRGKAHFRIGDIDATKRDLDKALEICPELINLEEFRELLSKTINNSSDKG